MTPPQFDLLDTPVPPWDRFGAGFVEPPDARTSDPATSHAAAAAYVAPATTQNGQITNALALRGPRGATAAEMAEAFEWTVEQVDRRISKLREAGLVFTFSNSRFTHNRQLRPGCLGVVVRRGGNYCIHVSAQHLQRALAHFARHDETRKVG